MKLTVTLAALIVASLSTLAQAAPPKYALALNEPPLVEQTPLVDSVLRQQVADVEALVIVGQRIGNTAVSTRDGQALANTRAATASRPGPGHSLSAAGRTRRRGDHLGCAE